MLSKIMIFSHNSIISTLSFENIKIYVKISNNRYKFGKESIIIDVLMAFVAWWAISVGSFFWCSEVGMAILSFNLKRHMVMEHICHCSSTALPTSIHHILIIIFSLKMLKVAQFESNPPHDQANY